jgi:hypothetical protein
MLFIIEQELYSYEHMRCSNSSLDIAIKEKGK